MFSHPRTLRWKARHASALVHAVRDAHVESGTQRCTGNSLAAAYTPSPRFSTIFNCCSIHREGRVCNPPAPYRIRPHFTLSLTPHKTCGITLTQLNQHNPKSKPSSKACAGHLQTTGSTQRSFSATMHGKAYVLPTVPTTPAQVLAIACRGHHT